MTTTPRLLNVNMTGPADPIEAMPVSLQVFKRLKREILTGDRKPGDSLLETQLAKHFGVSQASIRQALSELEKHDLAIKKPLKGTTVIKLSKKELLERLQVRTPLEILACREAVFHEEDYEELAHLVESMRRDSYPEADYDFHRLIWAKANNDYLYHVLDRTIAPIFIFVNDAVRDSLEQHAERHANLLEVLRGKDPRQIGRAVKEHVKTGASLIGAA